MNFWSLSLLLIPIFCVPSSKRLGKQHSNKKKKLHNGLILKESGRSEKIFDTPALGNSYNTSTKTEFRIKRKENGKSSVIRKGTQAAFGISRGMIGLTKKSLKYGFDLFALKHVSIEKISGKWKLVQDVELKKDVFFSCPATMHIFENGTILTICEGKEYRTSFIFKERNWPRACRISFDAYAFQSPYQSEPTLFTYKGYFKRSILNPNIVLIRGTIYRTVGKAMYETQ